MGRLKQVSDNAHSNGYSQKLAGLAFGVPGITLLSDGRLFTRGRDQKYRLSDQDGKNAQIVDIQAKTLQGRELPDGRLLCWTDKRIIILAANGKLLKNIKVGDSFQDIFLLSTGCFFPILGLKTSPMLYNAAGDPLHQLSKDGPYANVCGATELPNGRFVTWTDCYPDNHIWNADGTHYKDFNCHSLEQYSVTVISENRLLSVAADGVAIICDLDGNILFDLKLTSGINDARELPDGRFLRDSEDEDGKTWWHYFSSKGDHLKTIDSNGVYAAPLLNLSDDRYLSLSDGWSKSAIIWKDDCEIIARLEGHTHRINGALALNDGRIVTWSQDNTIRLWTGEGQSIGVLQGPAAEILDVLELDNGELLSSSADEQLLTWDTKKAAPPREAHSKDVSGLLQLKNGSLVTWSDTEGLIRIWDQTGRHLRSEKAGDTHRMRGVMKLQDGRYVSWGSGQHNRIFNQAFDYSHEIDGYSGDGVFRSTEKIVQLSNECLVMSVRSNFRIADLDDKPKGHFQAFRYTPLGMQALPDGRVLSYGDGIFFIHDTAGELIAKLPYDHPPVVLKDGRILLCRDSLKYFNSDGEVTDEFPISSRSWFIKQLEGQRILTSSNEKIRIYNLEGDLLDEHSRYSESSMGSTVLPDGHILTYGSGPDLVLRDTRGKRLAQFFGHKDIILGALSNDNGLIISWGRDQSLMVWARDGKALARQSFENPVQQVLPLRGTNDIAVAVANEMYIFRYETEAGKLAEGSSNRRGLFKRIFSIGE